MVTITFKAPSKLNAQIEAAARERRVPKSQLVREMLEKGFAGRKVKMRPTAYELSKHLCGSLRSGHRDLSTNKKHMEGFGADAVRPPR